MGEGHSVEGDEDFAETFVGGLLNLECGVELFLTDEVIFA